MWFLITSFDILYLSKIFMISTNKTNFNIFAPEDATKTQSVRFECISYNYPGGAEYFQLARLKNIPQVLMIFFYSKGSILIISHYHYS